MVEYKTRKPKKSIEEIKENIVLRGLSKPTIDAKIWFKENKGPSNFATNRFKTSLRARLFVESLYKAGVGEIRVGGIHDEEWRINDEGWAYASTLYIKDPSSRAMEILRNEYPDKLNSVNVEGSVIVMAWWD